MECVFFVLIERIQPQAMPVAQESFKRGIKKSFLHVRIIVVRQPEILKQKGF